MTTTPSTHDRAATGERADLQQALDTQHCGHADILREAIDGQKSMG